MNFLEKYENLARIARLIRQEATGNPKDFAKRCNLNSKDVLFDQIDILRQLAAKESAEILYDRYRETYYFSPPGKFSDFEFIKDIGNQNFTNYF